MNEQLKTRSPQHPYIAGLRQQLMLLEQRLETQQSIEKYEVRIREFQTRISEFSEKFRAGPSHPEMVAMRVQLRALERNLAETRRSLALLPAAELVPAPARVTPAPAGQNNEPNRDRGSATVLDGVHQTAAATDKFYAATATNGDYTISTVGDPRSPAAMASLVDPESKQVVFKGADGRVIARAVLNENTRTALIYDQNAQFNSQQTQLKIPGPDGTMVTYDVNSAQQTGFTPGPNSRVNSTTTAAPQVPDSFDAVDAEMQMVRQQLSQLNFQKLSLQQERAALVSKGAPEVMPIRMLDARLEENARQSASLEKQLRELQEKAFVKVEERRLAAESRAAELAASEKKAVEEKAARRTMRTFDVSRIVGMNRGGSSMEELVRALTTFCAHEDRLSGFGGTVVIEGTPESVAKVEQLIRGFERAQEESRQKNQQEHDKNEPIVR